jgi:hypothetical protein
MLISASEWDSVLSFVLNDIISILILYSNLHLDLASGLFQWNTYMTCGKMNELFILNMMIYTAYILRDPCPRCL